MGGLDWVQVDVGFPLSLAVVGAARSLGMERRAFLGAIVELQIWAVQALPSGRFEPFPTSADASGGCPADASLDEAIWSEAVEGAVRWTGAPGAFWAALLRTGILVREGDSVRLTLCDRYVQVLEKRKKEAERKRRERASKAVAASAGRPPDAPGTSVARKKREKETEKKSSSSAAAAMEGGMASGHLTPVPPPPPSGEALSEDDPVQLALPGTHLVPVSLPPEERRQAEAPEPDASPRATQAQAEAFFETFQNERVRAFRGVPREAMPAAWPDWYRQALASVGGDAGRLLTACRGYLHSDWGRSRQPAGTSVAFCSPKVWVRYVPHEQPDAAEPAEAPGLPSVDVSSQAGRAWQQCLARLHEQGKRYALLWLQKAQPVDVEDGRLILSVPDVYFRQWVEENYGSLVDVLVRDCGLLGVRWRLPAGEDAPEAAAGSPR